MNNTGRTSLTIVALYVLTLAGLVYAFLNRNITGVSIYAATWVVYSLVAVLLSRNLSEGQAEKVAKGSVSIVRWNAALIELVFFVLIFSNDVRIGAAVLAVYLVFGVVLNPFSFRKLTPAIFRSGRRGEVGET